MTVWPDHPDPPVDRLGRPMEALRVSITDRCNLRCRYCMPEEQYNWLPRASILSHEEMARLVRLFALIGVTRVRITGGEPLLRRDADRLVGYIAEIPSLTDIAMTTNGLLLARHAVSLKVAGLRRLTVSLDTLRPDRFREFARRGSLDDVLAGLRAAEEAGFRGTKINTVVVREFNDDEVADLLAFGLERGVEVRFIEYMDVGGATQWTPEAVVSRKEILDAVERRFGTVEPVEQPGSAAPAERFRLPDGSVFGVIASTTAPFCRSCGRSRITADGMWFQCLYAARGVDLKAPLRTTNTDASLAALVFPEWVARDDRGAEERLEAQQRGPLVGPDTLRQDPHREMHTRGG